MTTKTFKLNDDHLFMECDGVVTLDDGSQQPTTLQITVGDVRAYMADPNPCRCEQCMKTIVPAAKMLGLLAGRITKRQLERRLARMGYGRGEAITRH
jgi:hypothetical protein